MTPEGSPPVQDGIGSSESPAILGLDSFSSQFDVWRAKVEGARSTRDSAMMRWGRILEDVVAADFSERTGIAIRRVLDESGKKQRTLRMKGHPLITCRIDRRTWRRPVDIIEVKTSPYGTGFGEAGELADGKEGDPSGVPARVRVQVYHQLAVTGYRRAIVAALIGGYQRRDYVIERDEQIQSDLVAELEDWWAKYVETKTPPPVDGSDSASEYLRGRWPRETEGVIQATVEQQAIIYQLVAAKETLRLVESEEKLLRQRIAEQIGEHAGMTYPGGRISYKAHDVTKTAWEAVAYAYRVVAEELVRSIPEGTTLDLAPTVVTAIRDLDAVRELHSETTSQRTLRVVPDRDAS